MVFRLKPTLSEHVTFIKQLAKDVQVAGNSLHSPCEVFGV